MALLGGLFLRTAEPGTLVVRAGISLLELRVPAWLHPPSLSPARDLPLQLSAFVAAKPPCKGTRVLRGLIQNRGK